MSLNNMKAVVGVGFAIMVLWLAVVVIGPLLAIWALNTLFPVLAIAYTFKTWLAASVLTSLFTTNIKVNKD